jgi:triacylglycerol lipase
VDRRRGIRPNRLAGGALAFALAASVFVAVVPDASASGRADVPPPGANNWKCRTTATHPNPVVLVHGLGANMHENWMTISPLLASKGYCVFALTYGLDRRTEGWPYQPGGVVPMEQSAKELRSFVERVRRATRAAKVDIVGHSEGSLMPNYYVKFLGGAAVVQRYVGMTPLWKGTNLGGVGVLYGMGKQSGSSAAFSGVSQQVCGSCPEFAQNSEFLDKMNSAGGPRVKGVAYTMVMTTHDELVVPYTSGIMAGANNIVVQDKCPSDTVGHGWLAFDPVAVQYVLNALDPAHAQAPDCTKAQPIPA